MAGSLTIMKIYNINHKLKSYCLLIRLHKPIGIWLLLWPTLWALWLGAKGFPSFSILLIFISGVVLMRCAGCAINDYADRHFDSHVKRTQNRPLATQDLQPWEAVMVFCVLSLIAFMLVIQLNLLTIKLSIIALLLAVIYPFSKRYTHLAQFVLGAAFNFGIPMAFAAQNQALTLSVWLLYGAALLWSVVYDTMYAMVDIADDLQIGIKSTAILFGNHQRLLIALLQGLVLFLLLIVGYENHMGMFYYLGLYGALCFAIYQQNLLRSHNPELCLKAFLNNNWFGMSIFTGIFLSYL